MKDEQFIGDTQKELHQVHPPLQKVFCRECQIIATIIKRSFAHRDEQWRNKWIAAKRKRNGTAQGALDMIDQFEKALFTDKETKV